MASGAPMKLSLEQYQVVVYQMSAFDPEPTFGQIIVIGQESAHLVNNLIKLLAT